MWTISAHGERNRDGIRRRFLSQLPRYAGSDQLNPGPKLPDSQFHGKGGKHTVSVGPVSGKTLDALHDRTGRCSGDSQVGKGTCR